MNSNTFLPVTKKEAANLGWNELDVILFTGDAYIDHPSFGIAVIARVLENIGLKVAVVPQPNWQDDHRDFKKFGKPRLFFGVSSGNMDSMINHYTAFKRLRHDDAFTPGGRHGARPDYATSVYSKILKDIYPDVPIIIGGIEASLRRFTHYDYWSDKLKPSILIESGADMLVYGMGEKAIVEIAERLKKGEKINELYDIEQTAYIITKNELCDIDKWEDLNLNSHEECIKSKINYASNFKLIETESNKLNQKRIIQQVYKKTIVVNPANLPLSTENIDKIYDLPFTRLPHPKYHNKPEIPAYEMIKNSVNIHRGCFGGCSFCTISAHQGKFVSSRSEESILKEVDKVCNMPDFKGYISDVGGPSANMYMMKGKDLEICNKCSRYSCIDPAICNNLDTNHEKLLRLYQKINAHNKLKKAFIGSGIRYDLILNKKNTEKVKDINRKYLHQLIVKHTSGRLKVAPEHTVDSVLKIMRKPSFTLFKTLKNEFDRINEKENLKYQLIPYFISSHPGCTINDMQSLMHETKNLDLITEQVQDFTPTPMTLATVMYYSGFDPYTMKKVYVATSINDKKYQNSFFFKKNEQKAEKWNNKRSKRKRFN